MASSEKQHSPFYYQGEYRNCEITIDIIDDQYIGESKFHGQTMATITGDTFEETLQSLRNSTDQYHHFRQQQRKTEQISDSDYYSAMKVILALVTPSQRRLLLSHLQEPDYQCDVDHLLKVAELHSTIQLLLSYADIARKLSDELAYVPPGSLSVIDPTICVLMTPTGILTNRAAYDEMRTLQLRPEVAKALASMTEYLNV